MNTLMVQTGVGLYARLQACADGMILLEFGEIGGGAFYASTKAERISARLHDGMGWNLDAVQALLRGLHVPAGQSPLLDAALALVVEHEARDLQKLLQLHQRDEEAWRDMARLVRTCGRNGRLSSGALERFARGDYPPLIRAAAQSCMKMATVASVG